VSAQRDLEIMWDAVLMSMNGVDGVYDSDPRTNPRAKKLEKVSYQDALVQGLKVVDSTAFSLCMDNGMPMVVFGMEPAGNITKALKGDKIGTLVTA
jgi:uridylate kinase